MTSQYINHPVPSLPFTFVEVHAAPLCTYNAPCSAPTRSRADSADYTPACNNPHARSSRANVPQHR